MSKKAKEEEKKWRYFNIITSNALLSEGPEEIISRSSVFMVATSREAIDKAGVKIIKGECAEYTPVDKIEMNKKVTFIAGDPVKFKGTPTEIVKIKNEDYLKVMISEEVFLYSYINSANQYCLLQKIK